MYMKPAKIANVGFASQYKRPIPQPSNTPFSPRYINIVASLRPPTCIVASSVFALNIQNNYFEDNNAGTSEYKSTPEMRAVV